MKSGVDVLFWIPIGESLNFSKSIIEKYWLKYVILLIFMKYCPKWPLSSFFSKSPHSILPRQTFSWSQKCALRNQTGPNDGALFLVLNPFWDGVGGPYNPVFDRIPLRFQQCITCSNKLSTSGYDKNYHIFINSNDIQSQSVSFC